MLRVTPYQTPVLDNGVDLPAVIKAAIPKLAENSVLVIASKVVALWQQRVVLKKTGRRAEKEKLIIQEAEYYIPSRASRYRVTLTISNGVLATSAGIDESNVDARYYVLWPAEPEQTAIKLWRLLRRHYQVKHLGIVIADSRSLPLKWGLVGTALGSCGFKPVVSHIGKPDLYGRKLTMTKINHAEYLALVGVYAMGEAAQAQPLAVIEDAPEIEFQTKPPSAAQTAAQHISLDEDMFAPFLTKAKWRRGGARSSDHK